MSSKKKKKNYRCFWCVKGNIGWGINQVKWPERNLQQQTAQCLQQNVAEDTLAKQIDLLPCNSVNIGKISKKSSRKIKVSPTWDDGRILKIGSNSKYRKCKESDHMACLTNPTSQSSMRISPIWIPLISDEVTNFKRSL
jgi:hypothetical protein